MRWYTVVVLAAAIGVGVGFGAVYVSRANPTPKIAVEPLVFTCATDPEQGEIVSVPLTVKNLGPDSIVVTSVSASCGCTSIMARGGEPLTQPFQLHGSEVLPLVARVNTASRIGPTAFDVTVRANIGANRQVVARSSIQMNIRAGWAVTPPQLIFRDLTPGRPVSADVVITDSQTDPGIIIKEIVSSNTKAVHLADRTMESRARDRRSASPSIDPLSKERRRINVTLTPCDGMSVGEEWISVVPADEKRPTLRVPIFFTLSSPPYRVSPTCIVVSDPHDGDRVVRLLKCESQPGAARAIRLVRGPDFANVVVRASRLGPSDIVITLGIRKGIKDSELVFAADDSEKVAFTLPIRFYRNK